MSLIEIIENLKTTPRRQEEEYEFTSDFLEWFYMNIYREQGFNAFPILAEISKEPDYHSMRELCKTLINLFKAREYDDETLSKKYENMKQWTLNSIQKYDETK
jgi:hypothetical protein